jgi:hypothetical protein
VHFFPIGPDPADFHSWFSRLGTRGPARKTSRPRPVPWHRTPAGRVRGCPADRQDPVMAPSGDEPWGPGANSEKGLVTAPIRGLCALQVPFTISTTVISPGPAKKTRSLCSSGVEGSDARGRPDGWITQAITKTTRARTTPSRATGGFPQDSGRYLSRRVRPAAPRPHRQAPRRMESARCSCSRSVVCR